MWQLHNMQRQNFLWKKRRKTINIWFFFFFNENFVKTNFTFILLNAWQSIDIILRLINQSFLPQGGAAPLCPWIKIDCIIDLYFEPSSYFLQVFLRAGVLSHLDEEREDKLRDQVIRFQAVCRGHLARRQLQKLKVR